MKIFYAQNENESTLMKYGINNCYLKEIKSSYKNHIKKTHFHKDFEMHTVLKGYQDYEICGKIISVKEGDLLLIPPKLMHKLVFSSEKIEKIALSFNYDFKSNFLNFLQKTEFTHLSIPTDILQSLEFIKNETEHPKSFSPVIIENRLLEMIIMLFRQRGINETVLKQADNSVHPIFNIAKRYISDNIAFAPTPKEVAIYCHISERQLSRIFIKQEGVSVFEFIKFKRVEKIKNLLKIKNISLHEISEIMNFNNEYYFNAYFKAAEGMPPAAYRKMI